MSAITDLIQSLSGFTDAIKLAVVGKVDKVAGKQLSTEDYTTAEKTKLTGVKTMASRDLHVSTSQPLNTEGADGDIWIVLKP